MWNCKLTYSRVGLYVLQSSTPSSPHIFLIPAGKFFPMFLLFTGVIGLNLHIYDILMCCCNVHINSSWRTLLNLIDCNDQLIRPCEFKNESKPAVCATFTRWQQAFVKNGNCWIWDYFVFGHASKYWFMQTNVHVCRYNDLILLLKAWQSVSSRGWASVSV